MIRKFSEDAYDNIPLDVIDFDDVLPSSLATSAPADEQSHSHAAAPAAAPSLNLPVPSGIEDRGNRVLFSFYLLGLGMLFPWSAMLQAVDFFDFEFPGADLEYRFGVYYMLAVLVAMAGNLSFLNHPRMASFGVRFRATLGFALMAASLVGFAFFTAAAGPFGCCLFAALAGLGDGISQAAIFAFAATFPQRYTNAVM